MRDENFVPERILDALQRHQVEYLMVGGMAALAYGASAPPTTSTAFLAPPPRK